MNKCNECIYKGNCRYEYNKEDYCRYKIPVFSCNNLCKECSKKYICDKNELQVTQVQTRYTQTCAV